MIFGNSLLNELATLCTVIIQHPKMIENLNFFHIFNPFKDTYSFLYIAVIMMLSLGITEIIHRIPIVHRIL